MRKHISVICALLIVLGMAVAVEAGCGHSRSYYSSGSYRTRHTYPGQSYRYTTPRYRYRYAQPYHRSGGTSPRQFVSSRRSAPTSNQFSQGSSSVFRNSPSGTGGFARGNSGQSQPSRGRGIGSAGAVDGSIALTPDGRILRFPNR